MRVLATLHTADLFYNPRMIPVAKRDWQKIRLLLKGVWPSPLPTPSWPHTPLDFERLADDFWPAPYLSLDTEGTEKVTQLAVCRSDGKGFVVLLSTLDEAGREALTSLLRLWASTKTVVMFNAPHDLWLIKQTLGIRCAEWWDVEDALLAHAVFWKGYPHTLRFAASLYGQYPCVKDSKTPGERVWGDALATQDVWRLLHVHFKDDLRWARYEEIRAPSINAALVARSRGEHFAYSAAADGTWLEKPVKKTVRKTAQIAADAMDEKSPTTSSGRPD